MKKKLSKIINGFKLSLSGDVKKDNVKKMVENCSSGGCECMSETSREKITNVTVTGEDNDVNIEIEGDLQSKEIEDAIKKSSFLQ